MQHVEKPLVYTVGDTGFYSVEVQTVSKRALYPVFSNYMRGHAWRFMNVLKATIYRAPDNRRLI